MIVTLQLHELKNLLTDASELGSKKALIASGHLRPFLSQTEAHKLYGRTALEKWVNEGAIEKHKQGGKNSSVQFDRLELKALYLASSSLHYFNYRNKAA